MRRIAYAIVCPHCGAEVSYEAYATCHVCERMYIEACSSKSFVSSWSCEATPPEYMTLHSPSHRLETA